MKFCADIIKSVSDAFCLDSIGPHLFANTASNVTTLYILSDAGSEEGGDSSKMDHVLLSGKA